MKSYYPTLVEACVEFKVQSRILIASNLNAKYIPDQSDFQVEVSNQYRLIKDQDTGYVYCCKQDQSLKRRK